MLRCCNRFSVITVLILTSWISCSSPDEEIIASNCSTSTATFSQANLIFQSSCATSSSCHGAGSGNGPGPLQTYAQIFASRTAIRSAVASGSMPLTGSLTAEEKSTIVCWIENGAANN